MIFISPKVWKTERQKVYFLSIIKSLFIQGCLPDFPTYGHPDFSLYCISKNNKNE